MIHLEPQIISEGFPQYVADVSLCYGDVVREMIQQNVAIESLEVLNAAPAVPAEGDRRIILNLPLRHHRFPGTVRVLSDPRQGKRGLLAGKLDDSL